MPSTAQTAGFEVQHAALAVGVGAHRGGAAGLQAGQQRPFGGDGEPGVRIVEGGQGLRQHALGAFGGTGLAGRVGGAAFDRQRTLPGGGQHDVRLEVFADGVQPADPVQAGGGEHDGVEVAGLAVHDGVGRVARQAGDAAQAGVHVAADVPDVQVRTGGAQLGGAARGAGADGGALRAGRRA